MFGFGISSWFSLFQMPEDKNTSFIEKQITSHIYNIGKFYEDTYERKIDEKSIKAMVSIAHKLGIDNIIDEDDVMDIYKIYVEQKCNLMDCEFDD